MISCFYKYLKANNINYPCIDISVIKDGFGEETLLNYVFHRGLGLKNNHLLPKINLNAVFMLPTPPLHTYNQYFFSKVTRVGQWWYSLNIKALWVYKQPSF